jgi:hypothetical protein
MNNNSIGKILAVIVGIVILAWLSGITIGERPARKDPRKGSDEGEWRKITIDGLSLQYPWEFMPGVEVSSMIPEKNRADILSYKVYPGDENRFPKTSVIVSKYKPGFKIDLGLAVENAVQQFSSITGDSAGNFSSRSETVSGFPSRRISYRANHESGTMYVEALLIKGESTLWQVNSIHLGGEGKVLADRVVNSVRIEFP